MIHKDLKPQNVLLKKSEVSEYGVVAVIADFGLSSEIQEGETGVTGTTGTGTRGWLAREYLQSAAAGSHHHYRNKFQQHRAAAGPDHRLRYRKSGDIFSFGCLAQYVLSSSKYERYTHPFGLGIERERNILHGRRVSFLTYKFIYQDGKERSDHEILGDILIDWCVNSDHSARPTAEQLSKNPLFWTYTTKIYFIEKIFNDFKDKFETTPEIKELEENWRKYHPEPFTAKIPEAWGYHEFCRKRNKASKPSGKSPFNALMRNIRNIRQHCTEARTVYTVEHPHPDGQGPGSTLAEVLGSGSDEDIGRYFLQRIPVLVPVLYLTFYDHAKQRATFQEYYKNTVEDGSVVGGAWETLDRILTDKPRSRTPSKSPSAKFKQESGSRSSSSSKH